MFAKSNITAGSSSNVPVTDYKQIAEKLLKSEIEVEVSSIKGTQHKRIINLIKEAKEAKKSIIFTFTPGPFKSADELPKDWMSNSAAVGCTAQLTAFEKEVTQLDAIVYAVNKQSSEYQCGASGLLAAKKLNNLNMISDKSGKIAEELGLPTIEVNEKSYLQRFSIVIKPNGKSCTLEFSSSAVNDMTAKDHIISIAKFIHPVLEESDRKSFENN